MDADLRRRFHAAVDIIKGLPRDGPFKPSHEIQLKLYALYKQALNGPCRESKPSFWDVVKKAKWDAWTKLGDMTSADAMKNYVQELVKIVETMPQSDEVISFRANLESGAPVHEEAIVTQHSAAGQEDSCNLPERCNQQASAAISVGPGTTASSAPDVAATFGKLASDTHQTSSGAASRVAATAAEADDDSRVADDEARVGSDSDSESFCDSSDVLGHYHSLAQVDATDRVDDSVATVPLERSSRTDIGVSGAAAAESAHLVEGSSGRAPAGPDASTDVERALNAAVRAHASETLARLQVDVAGMLLRRLEAVEVQLRASTDKSSSQHQLPATLPAPVRTRQHPWWHPKYLFRSTSAQTLALMVWPFIVFWALNAVSSRRKRNLR